MKELKNKTAYADITLDINLSISYEDEHGELEELEYVKALDFLETIGYDELVMEKIWGDIADGCYWGMFDVELDCGCWVSVKWDIDGNKFTVTFDDGNYSMDNSCSELSAEFFDIFGADIAEVYNRRGWCPYLSHYWEEEINLDDYPNIIYDIERLTGYKVIDE